MRSGRPSTPPPALPCEPEMPCPIWVSNQLETVNLQLGVSGVTPLEMHAMEGFDSIAKKI